MKTDFELQTALTDALRRDERLVASDIGVAVRNGAATLTGEVDSLAKRLAATRAAEGVDGIGAFANDIVVRLPQDHWRTDTDIAHDAVNALIWDTEVPDKTIKVRVQDRRIWLVGDAESYAQRQAAEDAVVQIVGVKGVTNLVRVRR
ncbi:MAG: BON domain-containing protein [Gemmatimonadaceae bacterium]